MAGGGMRSGDGFLGQGCAPEAFRHAAWCAYQDEGRHSCVSGAPDVCAAGDPPAVVAAAAWRPPTARRPTVLLYVENSTAWAEIEVAASRARDLAAHLITAADLIEPLCGAA